MIKILFCLVLISFFNFTTADDDKHNVYKIKDSIDFLNEGSTSISQDTGISFKYIISINETDDQHLKHLRTQFEVINSIPQNKLSDLKFESSKAYNKGTNTCEERIKTHTVTDFYYFLPSLKAKVYKVGETVQFNNKCFKDNTLTFTSLDKETDTATLVLTVNNPHSKLCHDEYVLTTSSIFSIQTIFFKGEHHFKIKLPPKQALDASLNGIVLLSFCENAVDEIISLYKTARMYIGAGGKEKVTPTQERLNIDFIRNFLGFDYPQRINAKRLNIDKKDLHSGDFINILRLDGLGELIMLGTGSRATHCGVLLWVGNELYVVESRDGDYWKGGHGIQKNKYDDWINYAEEADLHVVVIPLKAEFRKKFDTDAAFKFFETMEGHHYGYHNFIYGWIDTNLNFPDFVEEEVFLALFGLLSQISPKTFDLIVGEGLNLRLGTDSLTLPDILFEAAKRQISFIDLLRLEESENFSYSDGPNYVCSSFAVAIYKAGGLFKNTIILPQEFTPKDAYQLEIFDSQPIRPKVCIEADPEGQFCQLLGKYMIIYTGVGTIPIYDNMNTKCNSQYPNWIRNENC